MAAANIQAYSYHPPPHEQGYYESLFVAADQARTGQLNGRDAVGFLSRSKLPVDLLKNIWTISDQNPKTNFLDKNKFFVSVRLIQFYQNGQTAQGQHLEADNNIMMRPPYFEGVTGVSAQPFTPGAHINQSATPVPSAPSTPSRRQSIPPQQPITTVPMPPQQHTSNEPTTPQRVMNGGMQQTALATQDPYGMLPAEQVRYEDLFPQYASDGFVYGKQAVELFSKSGLGKEILRDIWNLVDNPVDNRLSKVEFAIAMHLIICVSKKNLPLPMLLPPSLKDLKDSESIAASVPPPAPSTAVHQASNSPHAAGSVLPPLASSQNFTQGHIGGQQQAVQHGQNLSSGNMQPIMSISDAFNDLPLVESPPNSPSAAEKPGVQVQVQEVQQVQDQPYPPSSEPVQPPPEISINDHNKYNSSIVSGIPQSPALSSLPHNSVVPELPNLVSRAMSPNNHGGNDTADLDKCRSVLQRLQAENISLKAQLGQFTDEERKVQQDIKDTVTEIGSLSQELTGLRNQVVEAKASLIEATSELKAQIEKRDTIKELVLETSATKASIESSLLCIREVEETAKAKAQLSSQKIPCDNERLQSDFFVFDAGAQSSTNSANRSVNNDGYVDVPVPYYSSETHTKNHVEEPSNYASHVQFQAEKAPGFDGGLSPYPNSQLPVAASHASVPLPVVEETSNMIKEELEQLKSNLKSSEMEAKSASDLTLAISIQLDGLREEIEQLEDLISEKKNQLEAKRKGFMRGSNKVLKREIEIAEQDILEKKNIFIEAEASHGKSLNEAENLKKNAEDIRQEIEVRKSILLQQDEHVPRATAIPRVKSSTEANHSGEVSKYGVPTPANVGEDGTILERKGGRHHSDQTRGTLKSNGSLSTGLSLDSDHTSSEFRSNGADIGNPLSTGASYLPAQTQANISSSIEYRQVSAANVGIGYGEPLSEENNMENQSIITERTTGEVFQTTDEQQPHGFEDLNRNSPTGNPTNAVSSTDYGSTKGYATEPLCTTSPDNLNDAVGDTGKSAKDSVAINNPLGFNAPNDVLSQTDGSEHSLKGGTCASVAPSVASDPGYKRYSQPIVHNVDLSGAGSQNSRRASFGDMSAIRYEPAIQEIIENDSAGLASSSRKNEFNSLGLINESHKPVERNVGISKSDDIGAGMSEFDPKNSFAGSGVGASKSADDATGFRKTPGFENNVDSVYNPSYGGIDAMFGNNVASVDISSNLLGADNMITGTMGQNQGIIPLPRNYDNGSGNGHGAAPGHNDISTTFGSDDAGSGFGYSTDIMNKKSATSLGGSHKSATSLDMPGTKSPDTVLSHARESNMIPSTMGQDVGDIPMPSNYQSADIGMATNSYAMSSTFGGIPALNIVEGYNNDVSSYESARSLRMSEPKSTDTASSLFGPGNIMTGTTQLGQGGIPTPRNYDNGLGVGDAIALSNNAMPSTFGGIPLPKSNEEGTPFGYGNDVMNNKSVGSPGGSYESSPSIGTHGLNSTDNATSLEGTGTMKPMPMGPSQESIPMPINIAPSSNAMASTFGGVPETDSGVNMSNIMGDFGRGVTKEYASASAPGGIHAPEVDDAGAGNGLSYDAGVNMNNIISDFGQGVTKENAIASAPGGIHAPEIDDAGAGTGLSCDAVNHNCMGSPIGSGENVTGGFKTGGIEMFSSHANSDLKHIPTNHGVMDRKSDADSEDRIPSPSGSYSYDYGNPFLQAQP